MEKVKEIGLSFSKAVIFRTRSGSENIFKSFLISETGMNFLIWAQDEIRPGKRPNQVQPYAHKRTLLSATLIYYPKPCLLSLYLLLRRNQNL